jgi:hypothetical protein
MKYLLKELFFSLGRPAFYKSMSVDILDKNLPLELLFVRV